jgi:hypothetical protein
MPITKSVTRSDVLIYLAFDMLSGVGKATIRRTVDGEAPRDETYSVDGAQFAALLSTPGAANVSLADQVTNAVYQYLVTSGLVEGDIS